MNCNCSDFLLFRNILNKPLLAFLSKFNLNFLWKHWDVVESVLGQCKHTCACTFHAKWKFPVAAEGAGCTTPGLFFLHFLCPGPARGWALCPPSNAAESWVAYLIPARWVLLLTLVTCLVLNHCTLCWAMLNALEDWGLGSPGVSSAYFIATDWWLLEKDEIRLVWCQPAKNSGKC